MYSIDHRAQTIPKYAFQEAERKQEVESKNQLRDAVREAILAKSPELAKEANEAQTNLNTCEEGLKNSYHFNLSKLLEKFVLWPFKKGLKTSAMMTNGARLVLFTSVMYLIIVYLSKYTSFFANRLSLVGVDIYSHDYFFTFLIFSIPNVLFYVFSYVYLKICIYRSKRKIKKIENMINERENHVNNIARKHDTSNTYENSYGVLNQSRHYREPIRTKNNTMSSHPGVYGVLG